MNVKLIISGHIGDKLFDIPAVDIWGVGSSAKLAIQFGQYNEAFT